MENSILFANVRVLHAACFAPNVKILIGNREIVKELSFGAASGYSRLGGGFRRVSVLSAADGREVLSDTVFFPNGSQWTLVVCNTMNRLKLVAMEETDCKAGKGKGCIRFANFSFDDGPFDLMNGKMSIFSCVQPCMFTSALPAAAGDYELWLAKSEECLREYTDEAAAQNAENMLVKPEPAGDIFLRVIPGRRYTVCVLGTCGQELPLEIKTLEY